MMNIIRFSLAVIYLLFAFPGAGQSFKNRAAIEKVSKSGFYAIPVTSTLSSFLKPDFSDLRIEDEHGNAVPYIIKSGLPLWLPDHYEPLKILSNNIKDSGHNELVLENGQMQKISNFSLRIKNAAISRSARIGGSDDLQHWFSISENLNFEKRFITDNDTYLENISFPLSSYHYFRLTIENGKNDPLNILSAGRYIPNDKGPFTTSVANQESRFTQIDSSDHISYIQVFNQQSFHINSIGLAVRGTKFFSRTLEVVLKTGVAASETIRSDSFFLIHLPVFKTSFWEIRVINGDNPPLKITSVKTSQEPKKIILYLDSGADYLLKMTNGQASMPHYDLQDFRDSLSFSIPIANLLPVEIIPASSKTKSLFSENSLWITLFGLLIVLIYFTVKLAGEIPNKK